MSLSKPLDTIFHLLAARSRGDLTAALNCYEANATVVREPGKFACGETAVKTFIEATIALPITFGEHAIVEAEDIALHFSQWTIRRADGSEIVGRTTDVLRRQPDGNWLLAIDNPWGSSLLDGKTSS
jgi:ketosteroid isomerase-like protein